jgi:hypothetical protein
MAGRIGTWRVSYTSAGSSVFGRYGSYRTFFSFLGSSIVGRVGSARVSCFELDSNVSVQYNCIGASGGAEVLIPYLAFLYATGG